MVDSLVQAASGLPGIGAYGMQPNPNMGYYPGQMNAFPQRGPAGMMGYPPQMMPPRPGQPGGMGGQQQRGGFPGQQQMPGYPQSAYPSSAYGGMAGAPGAGMPRGGPLSQSRGPAGGNYPGGAPPTSMPGAQAGPRGAPGPPAGARPGGAPTGPQARPAAGNYKLNAGVRNANEGGQPSVAALTAQQLANASPPEQKQILGEAICASLRFFYAENGFEVSAQTRAFMRSVSLSSRARSPACCLRWTMPSVRSLHTRLCRSNWLTMSRSAQPARGSGCVAGQGAGSA